MSSAERCSGHLAGMNHGMFWRECAVREQRIKIDTVKNLEESASRCVVHVDAMRFRKASGRPIAAEQILRNQDAIDFRVVIIIINEMVARMARVFILAIGTDDIE